MKKFWANGLFALMLSVFAANGASANEWNAVEPDFDRDGVSDYDDYCPTTPFGRVVWTVDDYLQGRVALQYVGCASLEPVDPNYHPPQRPTQPPPPPPTPTLFGQTESMYLNGKSLPLTTLLGWTAGRCYWYGQPDRATGALFWSESRNVDGPAFPARQKFAVLTSPNELPQAYDQLDGTRAETVRIAIDDTWDAISAPSVGVDGIAWTARAEHQNVLNSVRLNGDYLIVRRSLLSAPTSGEIVRPADWTQSFCYFFKKL